MVESRHEFLKSSLIKRELETTPWAALVELASKQILADVESLQMSEIEYQCMNVFGEFDLNIKKSVKRLADFKLVQSTTLEIIEIAKKTLEREYSQIEYEDLETLYKLFVVDAGGPASLLPPTPIKSV